MLRVVLLLMCLRLWSVGLFLYHVAGVSINFCNKKGSLVTCGPAIEEIKLMLGIP